MITTLIDKTKELFSSVKTSTTTDTSTTSTTPTTDTNNIPDTTIMTKPTDIISEGFIKFNIGEKDIDLNLSSQTSSIFSFFNSMRFLDILRSNYIYESTEPETEVVINHKLDTENIIVQLWIKNDDGLWVNDETAITILDKDNVKVELFDPKFIKVIIKKSDYDLITKILNENNFNLRLFDDIRLKLLSK